MKKENLTILKTNNIIMGKILTILLMLSICCGKLLFANDTIKIDEKMFHIDSSKKLILINQNVDAINAEWVNLKTTIKLDTYYTFSNPAMQIEVGRHFDVESINKEVFKLYFTQLPIVSISSENIVVDEPRVNAHFSMTESDKITIEDHIGIEYRGSWSQTLPKKSLRIEFWADPEGSDTKNYSLLGMRSDDDWNLQAMYNEPLRIRSKTNYALWQMIDRLYYQDQEPNAINGVNQEYVELFFKGEYRGIYALSERVDRKQLKLAKYKNNIIEGELYKGVTWGASTFTSLPNYDNSSETWGGFELKHPDAEDIIDWGNPHNFVGFVINSDDATFYASYQDKFCVDNAVNYFIFLNLIRATDNTGKNLFIAKYKNGEPYFYVPWDLDGTFGIIWNGTQENITNDILSNGFYNRLLKDTQQGGFIEKLKNRWSQLRKTIIQRDELLALLNSNFNYLKSNGVYERELIAWPDAALFDINNMSYTATWLEARLAYLDGYMDALSVPTDMKDIAKQKLEVELYPNPTSNYLYINTQHVPLKIEIKNVTGQVVYQNSAISNRVDISAVRNGIYFVTVFCKDAKKTEKIMVER